MQCPCGGQNLLKCLRIRVVHECLLNEIYGEMGVNSFLIAWIPLKILCKSLFLEIRCVFTCLLLNNTEVFHRNVSLCSDICSGTTCWAHDKRWRRQDNAHTVPMLFFFANKLIQNLYFKLGWVICILVYYNYDCV